MTLLTAGITQVTTEAEPVRELHSTPWHALTIEFGPNQLVYIVSHEESIPSLPAGATVIDARIAEGGLPNIVRDAGHLSGRSTVSEPTYSIVDIDGTLSALFANKNLNGEGTFNTIIREYEWGKVEGAIGIVAEVLFQAGQRFTAMIQNHSWSNGVITIETADVNRELDAEIFEPLSWRLNESLVHPEQDVIFITLPPRLLPENQAFLTHTPQYLANPGERVAYARIEQTGEIFSYKVLATFGDGRSSFRGVRRGVLGTIALPVEVDPNTEPGNRPEISEWIVLDEEITDLVHGLITGRFYDGRRLPAHWTANSSSQWVERISFAENAGLFRMQFQNPGRTQCRRFFESQILAYGPAALFVNERGQLTWSKRITPTDAEAGQILLDESNCENLGSLTLQHDKRNINPVVDIQYDYSAIAERYLSQVKYVDEASIAHHNGFNRTKTYQSKGLHAGIHTGTQIDRLATVLGDENYYEKLELNVESLINGIPLGSLVSVDFKHVNDDASGVPSSIDLKRTMLVIRSDENRTTRHTTYTLSGTLQVRARSNAGVELHNLQSNEYKRGKINLADLAGINITNNIATGNITLVMGNHYYFVDDVNPGFGLEFADTLNINIIGQGGLIGLWVFGPFINKTTIDLTAKSNNRAGGESQDEFPALPGKAGFLFASRPSTGFRVVYKYSVPRPSNQGTYHSPEGVNLRDNQRTIPQVARNARMPDFKIDINNGLIGGLPTDLSGSSGTGPAAIREIDPGLKALHIPQPRTPTPTDILITGNRGGIGGGGLLVVSWGGGSVGNGVIITSGEDAQPAVTSTYCSIRGGPGMPGGLLWVVDGNHSPPFINSNNFHANIGDASLPGIRIPVRGNLRLPLVPISPYVGQTPPTPASNLWQQAYRVVYTPATESVQTRPLSEIDQAFVNQRDGQISLIVTPTIDLPSNGNQGDMAISQIQLDSGLPEPIAYILKANGWQRIDWSNVSVVYSLLLRSRREFGGNTFHQGALRPTVFTDGDLWRDTANNVTWILRESGPDELFLSNGTQLGDERFVNPNFLDGTTGWYFTNNTAEVPGLVAAQSTPEPPPEPDIYPPTNARMIILGPTLIRVEFDEPTNTKNLFGSTFTLNGAPIGGSILGNGYTGTFAGDTDVLYNFLTPDTVYTVTVQSISQDGLFRSESISVTGRTDTIANALNPPTNLVLTSFSGNTTGEATWTPPVDATGVDGYELQRDGSTIQTSAATNSFMNDLVPGQSYVFRVRSYSAVDVSDYITTTFEVPGGGPVSNDPTITVTSFGPTISGTTTNVEDTKQVNISFSGGVNEAAVVTGGAWSTANLGNTYAGQTFGVYVQNNAGIGVVADGQPFNYNT